MVTQYRKVLHAKCPLVKGYAYEDFTYAVCSKDGEEHRDEKVDLLRGLQHDDGKRVGLPGPACEHGATTHDLV
jgi:hypothetical protein